MDCIKTFIKRINCSSSSKCKSKCCVVEDNSDHSNRGSISITRAKSGEELIGKKIKNIIPNITEEKKLNSKIDSALAIYSDAQEKVNEKI